MGGITELEAKVKAAPPHPMVVGLGLASEGTWSSWQARKQVGKGAKARSEHTQLSPSHFLWKLSLSAWSPAPAWASPQPLCLPVAALSCLRGHRLPWM